MRGKSPVCHSNAAKITFVKNWLSYNKRYGIIVEINPDTRQSFFIKTLKVTT